MGPCRAANIHDYTAEQKHNRLLTRRQSQPEHVGLPRRSKAEYQQLREEHIYDEMLFRLRLESAVGELLESDSFSGSSPCSSAEHSPNLADNGDVKFHEDNVSDESGYSDDKDVISSSSSASSSASDVPETSKRLATGPIGTCLMAEEFTLNL